MENFDYTKPTGNYVTDMTRVRNLEHNGMWEDALVIRKLYNQKEDIDAIRMIIEANEKGDRFRELTKDANEKWQKREINNSQFHQILTEAHNSVYN